MLTFRKMITSYFRPITKGRQPEKKECEGLTTRKLWWASSWDFEAFRGLATTSVEIRRHSLPFWRSLNESDPRKSSFQVKRNSSVGSCVNLPTRLWEKRKEKGKKSSISSQGSNVLLIFFPHPFIAVFCVFNHPQLNPLSLSRPAKRRMAGSARFGRKTKSRRVVY